MSRVPDLSINDMNETQRKVHDEIVAGPRGGVGGPLNVWLRSPALADRAQKLGEFARFQSSLPPRLSELAILITARHWSAQYEWFAHEPIAREAGLKDAIIAAIKARQRPRFEAADEEAVYDFSVHLHHDRTVDEVTYRRTVAVLGEASVVDLVGILGYYVLVAMTLNAFEVLVPDGIAPPLDD